MSKGSCQCKYGVTKREMVGLKGEAVEGVIVCTDCFALLWLLEKARLAGILAGWVLEILEHLPLNIEHVPGKAIPHVGALIRPPFTLPGEFDAATDEHCMAMMEVTPLHEAAFEDNVPELIYGTMFADSSRLLHSEEVTDEQAHRRANEQVHRYVLHGIVLYHLWWPQRGNVDVDRETRYQWVVPCKHWEDLLYLYHDSLLGSHFGRDKQYGRMVPLFLLARNVQVRGGTRSELLDL